MATSPYLSQITLFGGNFAPKGWALCNGQLLSIQQNQALFALLGTNFGGNGTTTFGLPDFRGTAPMNWGQAPTGSVYVLGQTSGTENITLLAQQMPQHNHIWSGSVNLATVATADGNYLAAPTDSNGAAALGFLTPPATPLVTMSTQTLGNVGGSTPHQNMQPSLCVSFIIALTGIFPSRN